MKGAGMLVVSLRGVNFRFWSRLVCSEQNTIIFSRKGLFQGCTRINIKKLYIFNSFYLVDSCNQSLKWSLWATSRLVSFRGLIQNFRRPSPPLSHGSSPPPGPMINCMTNCFLPCDLFNVRMSVMKTWGTFIVIYCCGTLVIIQSSLLFVVSITRNY